MGYRVAFGRSLALGSSVHYDGRYTSWLKSWNAQEEGESRLNDVSFESQGLCRTGSNCQSPSYASIPRDIDAFLRFRVFTGRKPVVFRFRGAILQRPAILEY